MDKQKTSLYTRDDLQAPHASQAALLMGDNVVEFSVAELEQHIVATASQVVHEARDKKLWLGTAESCTAGLVAASIADIPGASSILKGGIVSYTIEIKERLLGVPHSIFEVPELGAVSSECAEAMAAGARRTLTCDIAVSVTGIAGPGGAEPGKPVGTVWCGLSSSKKNLTQLHHFAGDRQAVRKQASLQALLLLLDAVRAS